MSKFNQQPVQTGRMSIAEPNAITFEGGDGYTRSAKQELFLLSVTNMVSEDTFYENGSDRDDRFNKLIAQVVKSDPDWVANFVGYLRGTLNMRSASLVMAAEYVRAGGPNGRNVVSSAIVRGDEPAEMLAYWTGKYGRKIPAAVKRGVADAATRLFTERNVLKFDGQSKAYRAADVIELVHPKPASGWQSELFKYLLDKRHHADNAEIPLSLKAIQARAELQAMPPNVRHEFMRFIQNGVDTVGKEKFELAMAGQWEWAKSWLGEKGEE